jgi:hypothetical protein
VQLETTIEAAYPSSGPYLVAGVGFA